jgi:SP family general alpha glucoside:H+ symporter-like MFS transporter
MLYQNFVIDVNYRAASSRLCYDFIPSARFFDAATKLWSQPWTDTGIGFWIHSLSIEIHFDDPEQAPRQQSIMLLVGLSLMGIPWGVFQTLTTTVSVNFGQVVVHSELNHEQQYAAEVTPVSLRHYLTTYVNLCWVFGQFLASGVLKGVSSRNDQWANRIPYALQWIWPVPLVIGISMAPESPWWLVRKERLADAKHMVQRLTSRNQPNFNADETVAMMVHTNEMEKAVTQGTNYTDCFRGTDLRRTEICANVWIIQAWCGASFMGFSTYFYEQAGLDTSNAFTMSMVQYALGAFGVFAAWGLMGKFGRRTLYLVGLVIMCCLLLIIGFCGLASKDNKSAQWAIGSMLLIFTFVYDATVGPVCYSLVAEMASTRLRQKTVVLARNWYNIGSIINNVLTPRMLNRSAWNWGAKSGFFYAGTCFLSLVWSYFRLPEPRIAHIVSWLRFSSKVCQQGSLRPLSSILI